MNRDEILQKSRLENQGRDIADIEISKNGIRAGWLVVICLTMVVCIVDYLAFGRMCFELLFAVSAGLMVIFAYKYFRLRKRHEMLGFICYGVASICWLIAWILQIVSR